jgi:predicted RNA-binding protein with TRAM domain
MSNQTGHVFENIGPSADPETVARLVRVLVKTFEDEINAIEVEKNTADEEGIATGEINAIEVEKNTADEEGIATGEGVTFVDGMMAAHSFHVHIIRHIYENTENPIWFNVAAATFERAMSKGKDWKGDTYEMGMEAFKWYDDEPQKVDDIKYDHEHDTHD